MLVTTIWMGAIGFLDDYIKVFKKNKEGLAGRFKIIGQVGLGIIIACTMQYHPDILVRQKVAVDQVPTEAHSQLNKQVTANGQSYYTQDVKSTKTNLPFYKKNEFDYGNVLTIFGDRKSTRLNSSHVKISYADF